MAVYKRKYRDPKTGELRQSQVWWFDFIYAGKRICESAKTTRKTIAVEAEKSRRREIERAFAGLPTQKPSRRIDTVADILARYKLGYALGHRPKSIDTVPECV